jgi:chorismate mutase
MTAPSLPSLPQLRQEIDRIDSAMHELLMERGRIIDTLIEIKKTAESGSAFRPGREASMMREIVERHRGILPLDTVEGIWRVIISTFTYVQAPFSVHVDTAGGDAAMRDSVRFHFGFTVPFIAHLGAGPVIASIAAAKGDLGMVRLDQGSGGGPWWQDLQGEHAPKIIARLPFVERPDHPASTPVFLLAKPLADAAVREVIVASLQVERWSPALTASLAQHGVSVETSCGIPQGLAVLVSHGEEVDIDAFLQALSAGGTPARYEEIGSHARRFAFAPQKTGAPQTV